MNFTYDEVNGKPSEYSTSKEFMSNQAAIDHCSHNEYCQAVMGNKAYISMDGDLIEPSDYPDDKILKKNPIISGNMLSKEQIDSMKFKSKEERASILSVVEKDARVIIIIYKCPNEEVRAGLDFSKSEMFRVMFLESSGFELGSLNLPEGKYLLRQVFFMKVDEQVTADYSLVYSNSQLVTYVDNSMVKRSWTPGNTGFVHSVSLTLSPGVHSFVNDMSFDTSVPSFGEGEDAINMFFMPTFNGAFIEAYESPLIYSNLPEKANIDFQGYCTADKLTEDKCLKLLRSKDLNEVSSQHVKNMEINQDILPFIEAVYTDSSIDYDTVRDVKNTVEAYLISKFSTMDLEDSSTLLFLLKFMTDIIKTKLINQEILDACADESSNAFKSGVCRVLEQSLPEDPRIMDNIDKRNYLYCSTLNGNEYSFEKDNAGRCDKLTDSIREALIYSKCGGEWPDSEYCNKASIQRTGPFRDQRNEHFDALLNSTEGIASLARDTASEYVNMLDALDNLSIELGEKRNKLKEASKALATSPEDPDMIGILQVAFKMATSDLEEAELNYANIKAAIDLLPEEARHSEDTRREKLKYLTSLYTDDLSLDTPNNNNESKLLTDTVVSLYETSDCDACNDIYARLENSFNQDVLDMVSASKKMKAVNKCKEMHSLQPGSCVDMFGTGELQDIILYSGEVLRYCNKDPFSSECVKYYDEIYKKNSGGKESFSDKETHWLEGIGLTLVILFISICLGIMFFSMRKTNVSANTSMNTQTQVGNSALFSKDSFT